MEYEILEIFRSETEAERRKMLAQLLQQSNKNAPA